MITYPKFAEIEGRKYPINTDYRIALRCFEVVEDEGISDIERAYAIIYLLFGFISEKNQEDFLKAAKMYLQCGEPDEQCASERDMDLNLDFKYIIPSFRSDYGIDITGENMHFWRFIQLIQGLTPNCALSRVREIRNYDVSTISDPNLKRKIYDAKAALALPEKYTSEEQDMINRFNELFSGGDEL